MKVDLKLTKTDSYYDISFTNGDFTLTEGFDTALLMSIFCEKRANSSEIPAPERQRGWWGNFFIGVPNFEQGSKLWLLEQARLTRIELNKSVAYAQDGLSWLKQNNFADQIFVNSAFLTKGISVRIEIFKSQNRVGSFAYELWSNT